VARASLLPPFRTENRRNFAESAKNALQNFANRPNSESFWEKSETLQILRSDGAKYATFLHLLEAGRSEGDLRR
jgi:hypothetical protein